MRYRNGFTLIETTIVLVISAMILSLSLYMNQHVNLDHFKDFFFWEKFQNQFELAEDAAINNNSSVAVTFHRHGLVIMKYRNKKVILRPPENLTLLTNKRIEIKNNGYIAPYPVRWLVDKHAVLDQNFQLGWGKYTFHYERT